MTTTVSTLLRAVPCYKVERGRRIHRRLLAMRDRRAMVFARRMAMTACSDRGVGSSAGTALGLLGDEDLRRSRVVLLSISDRSDLIAYRNSAERQRDAMGAQGSSGNGADVRPHVDTECDRRETWPGIPGRPDC